MKSHKYFHIKKHLMMAYFELAKGSDCIDFSILLRKLEDKETDKKEILLTIMEKLNDAIESNSSQA